ncbi:MAG TPA: hypothetical protein GXZ43_04470 [Clostridiaceae bacterium]|nr:hypothetical protein [Clostridiaceae bacterium]
MIDSSQITEEETVNEREVTAKFESEIESKNENGKIKNNQSDKISYGLQVALISLGGILGIISAILVIAYLFFGDLIKLIF